MTKVFSNRVVLAALMLCCASASVVSLASHWIGLATLFGLAALVCVYRLSRLADAALSERERAYRREREKLMFERGPVGVWKQLLGPKAFNALVALSFLVLIAYLANEALFH